MPSQTSQCPHNSTVLCLGLTSVLGPGCTEPLPVLSHATRRVPAQPRGTPTQSPQMHSSLSPLVWMTFTQPSRTSLNIALSWKPFLLHLPALGWMHSFVLLEHSPLCLSECLSNKIIAGLSVLSIPAVPNWGRFYPSHHPNRGQRSRDIFHCHTWRASLGI